jgi:molecular chaperone HtpG
VSRGGLDLGALQDAEEKAKVEEVARDYADLVGKIREALGDRVKEVRVTDRLTDSPSCLVSDEGEISGTLQRMLKQAGQSAPETKPILEVNPGHALVKKLESDAQFDDLAHLLFDQAVLAEGGQLEDPAAHVQRMTRLLTA